MQRLQRCSERAENEAARPGSTLNCRSIRRSTGTSGEIPVRPEWLVQFGREARSNVELIRVYVQQFDPGTAHHMARRLIKPR
jgi:hypothetical protein